MITAVILVPLSVIMAFYLFFGVFTTVLRGTEKFVIQGEKYVKTINQNSEPNPLWNFFGVHFIGFSFQGYDIYHFKVNTDKENPEPDKKSSETWISKGDPRDVDFLLKKIPRMLVVNNAEIGNSSLQVDLGIALVFEAIDGATFVFDYKVDFTVPYGLIKAKVNELVSQMTSYNEVVQSAPKIAQGILGNTNLEDELYEFGLKLIEAKVVQTATDKAIEDAARKKELAEKEAESKKITADGDAKVIEIIAKAESDAIKLKLEQEIIALKSQGLSEEQITEIMKKKYLPTGLTHLATDLFKF